MTVTKAIAIAGGVALAAILFFSLTTGQKVSNPGPSPSSVAELGTGRPALYEFSTDS